MKNADWWITNNPPVCEFKPGDYVTERYGGHPGSKYEPHAFVLSRHTKYPWCLLIVYYRKTHRAIKPIKRWVDEGDLKPISPLEAMAGVARSRV